MRDGTREQPGCTAWRRWWGAEIQIAAQHVTVCQLGELGCIPALRQPDPGLISRLGGRVPLELLRGHLISTSCELPGLVPWFSLDWIACSAGCSIRRRGTVSRGPDDRQALPRFATRVKTLRRRQGEEKGQEKMYPNIRLGGLEWVCRLRCAWDDISGRNWG